MNSDRVFKLRGCILTIWNDATRQNMTTSIDKNSLIHEIIRPKGGQYRIGFNGIKATEDALKILSEDPYLSHHYSQRYLNKEIQDIVLSLLHISPQEIAEKAQSLIQQWIQKLRSKIEVEWRIVAPISNLIIGMDSIEVGKVIFLKDRSIAANTLINEINQINKRIACKQVEEYIVSLTNQRLGDQVLAVVKLTAMDERMAKEVGTKLIEHSLNVLRLFGFGVMSRNPLDYKMYIGIKGTVFSGKPLVIAFNQEYSNNLTFNTAGAIHPYEFNDESIQRMNQLSFQSLNLMLKKEQKNEFEKLLDTSIDFFGAGMNDADLIDSYIDFIISLESLVLKEREPSKGLLAERVSLIIGDDSDKRIEIFDYMEMLYQLRSDIVHRGSKDITKENLKLIAFFAFSTIITLTSHLQMISRIDDLIDICNKLKFSGPSFGK